MSNKKTRNGFIELMRFLFAVMMVLFHGAGLGGGSDKALFSVYGGIGVEFYFIVSGYLMAHSASRFAELSCDHLGQETIAFLWKKLKGFLPYYCLAAFAQISYLISIKHYSKQLLLVGLWDFLLLSATGVERIGIVGASWYLSAMMLGMAVLYPIIRKCKETYTHIIAPLLAVLLLGYLSATYGTIEQWLQNFDVLCGGFIRAIAELSLGVVCHTIVQYLSRIKITALSRFIIGAASISGYICVFYLAHNAYVNGIDAVLCLIIAFSTTLAFWQCDWKILQKRIIMLLGELSMVLYLNHRWVQYYIRALLPKKLGYHKLIVIFVITSIAASISMMLLWRAIQLIFRKYGKKISALFIVEQKTR